MGHEVGDALEHAAWLQDERRERHFLQIHANSTGPVLDRQRSQGGGCCIHAAAGVQADKGRLASAAR